MTAGATAPTDELFATDAYVQTFEASVAAVDADQRLVALDRTAFYPGGGGQPHDIGRLRWHDGAADVARTRRVAGRIWHAIAADQPLPDPGAAVEGRIDWERRHLLMRTHTALHILCGVIWHDFAVAVTGGNMEPGTGRLDFELPEMSAELGRRLEQRINQEIARARAIAVEFVDRADADTDPALIRTKANLIPAAIDPLRVIDIVGLDRQADGGTHVATTADVGAVDVTGTQSKGRANKRVRIAVRDRSAAQDRSRT
ncbi:MAG TPA: alanyl-tRNA editing protein [Euzebyales bacterium]|nr:alanyl-tRNA editing protein [Euzebyales bacterium]